MSGADGGVHVDVCGSGPAVVLLHGTPSSPDDFAPLIGRLAGAARYWSRTFPVTDGPARFLVEADDAGAGRAHATIEMTVRYAHLSLDTRRDAVSVLDLPVPDRTPSSDRPANRVTTAPVSGARS
jgi:hypothetical protein